MLLNFTEQYIECHTFVALISSGFLMQLAVYRHCNERKSHFMPQTPLACLIHDTYMKLSTVVLCRAVRGKELKILFT